MFRFEHVEILYLLVLIPVFVIIYLYNRRRRLSNLKKFGDLSLISRLFPDSSVYKHLIKTILILIGFGFLILGIANPQIGTKLAQVKREGVDIVILLDISNSMKSEDVKPNRLERAKLMVSRLIDKLQGDRIGIIVFAGEPYIQLPMTTDYAAAKLFLSFTDTDLIPTQGTAIGSAIELAVESFKIQENKRKAMILMTDGENFEDDALKAASDAAKQGYIIHTIGMGTLNGGPVPVFSNGLRSGFLKDETGNMVVSKMDPNLLQQISSAGGGEFIVSGDAEPDLSNLIEKIAKMDKTEYESKLFSDYEDRFQYFIGAAFLFIFAEILFNERKNKFIASLKLFEGKRNIQQEGIKP